MEIRLNTARPSFGIKVYNNYAYHQVVGAAKKCQCVHDLDNALNNLLHIQGDNLLIVHGYKEGKIFSTFVCGKRTVFNETQGCATPEDASLRGLLRFIDKDDSKLMRLLNSKVKRDTISTEFLTDRYTVSNK